MFRFLNHISYVFILFVIVHNFIISNISNYYHIYIYIRIKIILINIHFIKVVVDSQQPSVVVYRSINSKDGTRSFVSQNGPLIDTSLSELEDLYFEIESPEDIKYTYRVRIAKNFGSSFTNIIHAKLIIAEPYQACDSNIINSKRLRGNIALILRG